MPRPPRYREPGIPQHVTKRGINREAIFRDTSDYHKLRQVLLAASRHAGVSVHHYAFMVNHIHLLATPAEQNGLSNFMQWAMAKYTRWFNVKYQRTGTIWEGRYWAAAIDSEAYFLRCACYIDLNPVRAGKAITPGAYAWTSYRHYAEGVTDILVSEHELIRNLGEDASTRRAAYEQLIQNGIADEDAAFIRESTLTSRLISV